MSESSWRVMTPDGTMVVQRGGGWAGSGSSVSGARRGGDPRRESDVEAGTAFGAGRWWTAACAGGSAVPLHDGDTGRELRPGERLRAGEAPGERLRGDDGDAGTSSLATSMSPRAGDGMR